MTDSEKFPLNRFELIGIQADRGKARLPMLIAILADDDVAAPKILKVIRESAKRSHNCVRVPSGLVFNAVPFDSALSKQIVQVER